MLKSMIKKSASSKLQQQQQNDNNEAESHMMDDEDMKSVRSSGTTASSRLVGGLKSKLMTVTPFGKKKTTSTLETTGSALAVTEDDEMYRETPETIQAAAVAKKQVDVTTNTKVIPKPTVVEKEVAVRSDGASKALTETQRQLEEEKRKAVKLQQDFGNQEQTLRRKVSQLELDLEKERSSYHLALNSLRTGDGQIDDAVRIQADAIQELQAINEAVKSRVDQLEVELQASEAQNEALELAITSETRALQEKIELLEKENLKTRTAITAVSSSQDRELIKGIEKERDALKQKVLALEVEKQQLEKLTKNRNSKSDEDVKSILSENAELKQQLQASTVAFDEKLIEMGADIARQTSAAHSLRTTVEQLQQQLADLQGKYHEKEAELTSIAVTAERELSRLEQTVKDAQQAKVEADNQVKLLQAEVSKGKKVDKENLENDEQFQKALNAARKLLKDKKISKQEFDQVTKAAMEASRAWNQ